MSQKDWLLLNPWKGKWFIRPIRDQILTSDWLRVISDNQSETRIHVIWVLCTNRSQGYKNTDIWLVQSDWSLFLGYYLWSRFFWGLMIGKWSRSSWDCHGRNGKSLVLAPVKLRLCFGVDLLLDKISKSNNYFSSLLGILTSKIKTWSMKYFWLQLAILQVS